MARPRTNESNWWQGEGEEAERAAMKILVAAAKVTLRKMDPGRTNFVEVGDLVSEGWLCSMRYATHLGNWASLHCMMHMRQQYIRLKRRIFSQSRNRPMTRTSDDYPLLCHKGQWGSRCLDIWDAIETRCTPRQQRIAAARWQGYTRIEAAQQEGLTSAESVRLELHQVRQALRDLRE